MSVKLRWSWRWFWRGWVVVWFGVALVLVGLMVLTWTGWAMMGRGDLGRYMVAGAMEEGRVDASVARSAIAIPLGEVAFSIDGPRAMDSYESTLVFGRPTKTLCAVRVAWFVVAIYQSDGLDVPAGWWGYERVETGFMEMVTVLFPAVVLILVPVVLGGACWWLSRRCGRERVPG